MSDLPKHNTDEAVSFIALMFQERPVTLVAITTEGNVKAKTFRANDGPGIERWVERWQGKGNVYFQVNELREGFVDKKAKKGDVVLARYLHVDIDDEDALDRIVAFAPPPTVVVFSGGGFQLFYRLREPTPDLDRVEWGNAWLGKQLGGDNTHNIDRIMRLPGTINLPNAKKVEAGRIPALAYILDAHWERAYSLEAFGAGLADATLRSADAVVVPKAYPDSIQEEIKSIIETGDDPIAPRGSNRPHFRSRSEAVFSVSCNLGRAGCTREQIAGVLINSAYRISESVLEKKGSVAYALKQADKALMAISGDWPDVSRNGKPRPSYRNAVTSLRRLGVQLSYDLFRHRRMVAGVMVEDHAGAVDDNVCTVLRDEIISRFDFDPGLENVMQAVNSLCLENRFHPIIDMLGGLRWDGVPRLASWLSVYLGARDNELNREIGTIMLVAAVRRVRQPGVKFDEIPVLEGPQGSGKSTALQILAGDGCHSDQEILTLDSKAQIELMEGVWIYELGEVEGLNKAEVNKIKAFASRQEDRARLAYAKIPVSRPRQNIFIGTTNEHKYLRDQTGNRRFWPIETGAIDLTALRRDRDQLWAEAAELEASGRSITLPKELWELAAVEQAQRLEEDPWMETLAQLRGVAVGEEVRLYTADILTLRLGIPKERQNQGHSKRIATILRKLGWEPANHRVGGAFLRGYRKPKPPDHQNDPDDAFRDTNHRP